MEERINGAVLKKLRQSLSISRKTFAYLSGVSEKEVKDWEKGKSYPDEEIIQKLFDLDKISSRNTFFTNNKIQSGLFGSYCSRINVLTGVAILFVVLGLILFATCILINEYIFVVLLSSVSFLISVIILVIAAIRINFLINYGIEFTVYKKVLKRKLFKRVAFFLISSISCFITEIIVFACLSYDFTVIKTIAAGLVVLLCIIIWGYIFYIFVKSKSSFVELEEKLYSDFQLNNFIKIFCPIFFISIALLFALNYIFAYVEDAFHAEKEYSFYNKNRLIRFVEDSDLFNLYSYTFIKNKYPLNKETEAISVKCLFSDIRDESILQGYDYVLDGYSAMVTVMKYNCETTEGKIEFYVLNKDLQNCDISVEYNEDIFEYKLKVKDHFIFSLKTYVTVIVLSTSFITFIVGAYIYYQRRKTYLDI